MALTQDQLNQLNAWYSGFNGSPGQSISIGGNTYNTMGVQHQDEGGLTYQPSEIYRNFLNPDGGINTSLRYVVDPTTGKENLVNWNHGGNLIGGAAKDLGTIAAMFAAMYMGGQAIGGMLGAGGAGAGAGAGGVAGSAPGAGEVLSKAALDGTTAFGANSVPGAFDLASMGAGSVGAAGAAGSGGAVNPFAAGFTDTGTAGGALDTGYAGSGALTGASGAVAPMGVGGSGAVGGSSGLSSILSGGSSLGGLLGAGLGALGSGKAQGGTVTKGPWEAAVPWLTANLAGGQALQNDYMAHPFNAIQQGAYRNLLAGNDYINQAVPGLLSQMSQQGGFDRNNPRAQPSAFNFGPGPQMAPLTGLLGSVKGMGG